jgi:hypothetical protein
VGKTKAVADGSGVNKPTPTVAVGRLGERGVFTTGFVAVGDTGMAVSVAFGVGEAAMAVWVSWTTTVCAADVKTAAGSIGVGSVPF